jgi:tetratricopeptide (TPR) repeat protein
MITVTARAFLILINCLALVAFTAAKANSQENNANASAIISGTVCDAENRPVEYALVSLESADHARKFTFRSDSQGRYRFEHVASGTYALLVSHTGYPETKTAPFVIHEAESKTVTLRLSTDHSSAQPGDALSATPFSEETQFNVAGVTDPSNLGGHGSDVVLRTREALAKDTASLSHEAPGQPAVNPQTPEDIAEAHARLADAAESAGRPLEAVREYQMAAELEPNESHLFSWGADLLLHRAYEPAIEVFARGRRRYPDSVRMLLGLGVATYDRGAMEQGEKLLLEACNLNPGDPTPYLFLGQLQQTQKIGAPRWTEMFQRFVALHPENALAHYYYAVALGKPDSNTNDYAAIESELKKSIELDPRLGDAYLQLGVLYSKRENFPAAITAFQKVIAITPLPDEAHYRLAQVYGHMGEADKSAAEIELFKQVSEQKKKEAERERHQIQQFVYTLRSQGQSLQPPASDPR